MAEENLLTLKNGAAWGAALAVELKRQVKKSQGEVMRDFTKNLVSEIIALTPPQAGKHRRGVAAKKRGERTTEVHIRRVFEGVTKRKLSPANPLATGAHTQNQTIAWMAAAHKRARRKGRVERSKSRHRHKVMKGQLNRYIRMRKSKVGALAAGWHAAADEFGVRGRNFPAWMRRHQGKVGSSAKIVIRKDNIHIRFSNRVRFAGDVAIMKRRLSWAMGVQADKSLRKKMRKGLKDAVKRSKIVDWK